MDLLKIPARDLLISLIHTANELIPSTEITPEQKNGVRIIAHRGAVSNDHPENTIASFRKAIELGVHGIELDLHITADEQVVIQHDHNLKRIFGSNHAINDLTLTELKQTAPQLPTLQELLDYVPDDLLLFLEIKKQTTPGLDRKLARKLTEQLNGVGHPVYLITLHPDLLLDFPVSPSYKRIPIFPKFSDRQIRWTVENRMDGIFGYYWFFSERKLAGVKERNLVNGCGMINGVNLGRRFIGRGFDIIFTDRADLLLPLIK